MDRSVDQVREEYDAYKSVDVFEQIGREVFGDQFVGQESSVDPRKLASVLRAAGIGNESRVLDAGCGKGGVPLALAERLGCSVVGIDISTAAIAHAASAASRSDAGRRCTFYTGNLQDTGLPDDHFDAILAVSSLYWSTNKLAPVFSEWRRVLRSSGGLAIILITRTLRRPSPEEHELLGGDYGTPISAFEDNLRREGFSVETRNTTDAYVAWLDDWRAALERHAALLSQQMGRDAAQRFRSKFSLLQAFLEEGNLANYELVATHSTAS